MKIRLKQSISGTGGVFPAGSVMDADSEEAKRLIAADFAEPYIEEGEEATTSESRKAITREKAVKRVSRRRKK